ncbi:hypothetical protein ACHAPJ_006211 [Fusarium lateritium]
MNQKFQYDSTAVSKDFGSPTLFCFFDFDPDDAAITLRKLSAMIVLEPDDPKSRSSHHSLSALRYTLASLAPG